MNLESTCPFIHQICLQEFTPDALAQGHTACFWRQRGENTPNIKTEEQLWVKYNKKFMFKRIIETELDMSREKQQVSTTGFHHGALSTG